MEGSIIPILFIFWFSFAILVAGYIFYPIFMIFISMVVPKKRYELKITPSVSIIIPAYNEEKVIEKKIENSLSIDYPPDKFEIIIVSDASDDRTDEIVSKYACSKIKLVRQKKRRGKLSALNLGAKEATGDILVFTDANSMLDKEAISNIVMPYSDPKVGGVAGEQVIIDEGGSAKGEGIYWRMEAKLKDAESRIGSVIGADGSIYSIRRKLYPFFESSNVIMDDFAVSASVITKGYKLEYVSSARSYEGASNNLWVEFLRKARVYAGSGGAILLVKQLLLRPFVFKIIFHKLVRWVSPFLLMILFCLNIFLINYGLFYKVFFIAQSIFYGLSLVGLIVEVAKLPQGRLTYFPLYFTLTNAAEIYGLFGMLTGKYKAAWKKLR
jgi:cellulose synthase/poly-beta-1,6-N-acetylglucosamine synthase-like glycosyltransferase